MLSSPDIRAALENVQKDFVVVPIDKATGNIALVCKRFYASVIAKELGLGNNNTTDTYNSINNTLLLLLLLLLLSFNSVNMDFVVVPIDKATGNIALVCKRDPKFYASVIAKELGLGNNNTTDTYE